MSDVGYLSYQHEQATQLAGRLVKALAEAHEGQLTMQTRQQLALKLVGLIALLEPLGGEIPYAEDTLSIPIELVELLRKRNFHGQSFVDALSQLNDHLLDRHQKLNEVDVEVLEQVVDLTEKTALSTYRRMVRG